LPTTQETLNIIIIVYYIIFLFYYYYFIVIGLHVLFTFTCYLRSNKENIVYVQSTTHDPTAPGGSTPPPGNLLEEDYLSTLNISDISASSREVLQASQASVEDEESLQDSSSCSRDESSEFTDAHLYKWVEGLSEGGRCDNPVVSSLVRRADDETVRLSMLLLIIFE